MKKFIIMAGILSAGAFAAETHSEEELAQLKEDHKKLYAFVEKQICTRVVTQPAVVGNAAKGDKDFKKLNIKFDIIEWRQSNWGGLHQTKSNLTEMVKLKLNKLSLLNLGQCRIDDEDMKNIGKLQSLKTLILYGNPKITDRGLKELHGLKSLTSLELDGVTKISEKAVNELRKALPNCNIILKYKLAECI